MPSRHFLRDLETNPKTQYWVHVWATRFWIVNIPAVLVMYFWFPDLWDKVGLFLTLLYSLYANWSTDFGGVSAAEAAMNKRQHMATVIAPEVDATPPPAPAPVKPPRRSRRKVQPPLDTQG